MAIKSLTKKQRETLGALEKLAKRAGVKVSYGRLNYAGLRLKGGGCWFKGRKWLILDRLRSFEEQLEVYQRVLSEVPLPPETEPDLRPLLAPSSASPPSTDEPSVF